MDVERLAQALDALGSLPRLRIIASLAAEPTHVSQLARRLGMSRALLYTHLNRLEAADLVESRLETSGEGHVKKHYWVADFVFEITPITVRHIIEEPPKENQS